MNILVTGAAGFIGSNLSLKLLDDSHNVVGVDNFNNYYDNALKKQRIRNLINNKSFICHEIDLCDQEAIRNLFTNNNFDVVINLAAQAGVRYSIDNPNAYTDSNLVGFMNILEAVRNHNISHLIYASSSSVYGNSPDVPYKESQIVNKPISLYAATKISNELLASSYSHLYNFSTTGLRFFTVYGPWGRPDMAYYMFSKNIVNDIPINVFARGLLKRDFTYIDDIIDGINLILNKKISTHRSEIFNLGNSKPVVISDFINILEEHLQKNAIINYLPMQPGDVEQTFADLTKVKNYINYSPKIDIDVGLSIFCKWYKEYHNI
jgi:UDP-glucuronate 4-epimerase